MLKSMIRGIETVGYSPGFFRNERWSHSFLNSLRIATKWIQATVSKHHKVPLLGKELHLQLLGFDSLLAPDVPPAMLVYRTVAKKKYVNLILLLCKTWATFCYCFVHHHVRLITWVQPKNWCLSVRDRYTLWGLHTIRMNLDFGTTYCRAFFTGNYFEYLKMVRERFVVLRKSVVLGKIFFCCCLWIMRIFFKITV